MTPELQAAFIGGAIVLIGAITLFIKEQLALRTRMDKVEAARIEEKQKRDEKAEVLKLGSDEQRQKLDTFVLSVAQQSSVQDLEFRRIEELRRTDAQEIGKLTLEISTLRSKLEIADRVERERDQKLRDLQQVVNDVTRENTDLKQVITSLQENVRGLSAINAQLTKQLEEIPLLQKRVEKLESENAELRALWTTLQTSKEKTA